MALTDKQKLELAREAIMSLSRALYGLYILARQGNKVTVITSLAHLSKRCKEVEEEIS